MSSRRGFGIAVPLAVGAIALGVAGCGSSTTTGGTIIRGTTDKPVSYDPAGAYDLPSYDAIYAIYQNLLTFAPGANTPSPDAAQSCDFTNPTTYKCTLKSGLKFSDGSALTSKDVKFSFDRNLAIQSPTGGASLMTDLKSTSAPDPQTVIFHLKAPDSVWPDVLTTGSASIVPDSYPADKLQPSEVGKIIGSGRYTLASYKPTTQTVLKKNPDYNGPDPAQNDTVIIQYFDTPSALAQAVKEGSANGGVDVAYRSLSPEEVTSLQSDSSLQVVEGNGIEIRYLVFNESLQPGSNDAQKLAIRQAVAYTIDRQAIAKNVYNGTVQPLYSMVPQGLKYATTPFKTLYGAKPNVAKAKQVLAKAGINTPVPLEIWYTPSHYGASSGDEYAEIKHELDASGLFNVTLKSSEWNQYSTAAFTNKYPIYQLGWFPDYPDADDYTAPFYKTDSFLNDHFIDPAINKLVSGEEGTTNSSTRGKDLAQIQQIGAKNAVTIPYFQGKQVAVAASNINGIQETFDPSFIFRYWLITKG